MSEQPSLQGPDRALTIFLVAVLFGGAFFAFFQSITAGLVAEAVTAAGAWGLLRFVRGAQAQPPAVRIMGAIGIAVLVMAVRTGLLFLLR
ncbi:hypothetical protein [Hymenobacter jeollabukensis]|uniref:Uncharacterized protein n=1 Tax=Hymenobacter jeollabukensis TaxID=2025313 RepID=A0A5R8WNE8_9BACT|nr:hypothetical protein [Hymenobacter jeollabukensis]TLM90631.1 hypothetical protein FDY95_18160 [Hymenobacter jeollabukensis]